MRDKLITLVWLLPVLLGSQVVDSTEIPAELSTIDRYEVTNVVYGQDFQYIPQYPNVYEDTFVYEDVELSKVSHTIKPDQKISIIGVFINSQNKKVFQIKDGSFIAASREVLFDDVILSEEVVEKNYWLKQGFRLVSSPIASLATDVKHTLSPYQSVKISKIARTHRGEFGWIEGKGWLHLSALSSVDNRIEAVQRLLQEKYNKSNLGIYVKQLSTGNETGINQDKEFYSASISKLPTLYYAQSQLNLNKFSLEDKFKYIKETEDYDGAYDAAGSGSISKVIDNKDYLLSDLLNRISKESDNVASNIVGYYVANQFDEDFNHSLISIIGQKWDMVTRETSAEIAGKVMEAIYHQGGFVLESMKQTNFDNQRIPKDIPVPVAHKIGDAYDFRHDVAIVYAESPFVLSIFTDKSSYDEITQIANDIYGILK
ncbi:TPA: serine hydrolase [Streptococcus suis]|nr:serine hydrolase [Streptococcus suis]